MLLREINANAPGGWLPVKPAPPALGQQVELSRMESGSDRDPGEAPLQPEIPDGVENQLAAVKNPTGLIGKANDPAATPNEKSASEPHAAFILDRKNVCLWLLHDPQGLFIESKTVCEITSQLKIELLSGAQSAVPG